jgi:hypothetical protein
MNASNPPGAMYLSFGTTASARGLIERARYHPYFWSIVQILHSHRKVVLMAVWLHSPVWRRSAPLSGAAKYPAGARPSKCIIIIFVLMADQLLSDDRYLSPVVLLLPILV